MTFQVANLMESYWEHLFLSSWNLFIVNCYSLFHILLVIKKWLNKISPLISTFLLTKSLIYPKFSISKLVLDPYFEQAIATTAALAKNNGADITVVCMFISFLFFIFMMQNSWKLWLSGFHSDWWEAERIIAWAREPTLKHPLAFVWRLVGTKL